MNETILVDGFDVPVTVWDSTDYDESGTWRGENVLTNNCERTIGIWNNWNSPNMTSGDGKAYIILNLGKIINVNRILAKNTHNGQYHDRGSESVSIFTSNSGEGPWELVAENYIMPDARNKDCEDIQVQVISVRQTAAQFVKLVVNSYYGGGGGLQYLSADDGAVKVWESTDDCHSDRWRGENVLINNCEGVNHSNYWNSPKQTSGDGKAYIILNLGKIINVNRILAKNSHNGKSKDRGCKSVSIFTSKSRNGPWKLVPKNHIMADAINKACNEIPVEEIPIPRTSAQFIKLVVNSYYRSGGGLQYLSADGMPHQEQIAKKLLEKQLSEKTFAEFLNSTDIYISKVNNPVNASPKIGDVSAFRTKYPKAWIDVITSKESKKKIKQAFEHSSIDDLDAIFNVLEDEEKFELFGKSKIHLKEVRGKTFLQILAEEGNRCTKQREDFVKMLIMIDKKQNPSKSDKGDVRIIDQLKKGMESSKFLVDWIECVKNNFPISNGKRIAMVLIAIFALISQLGLFLLDFGTDVFLVRDMKKYSSLPNEDIYSSFEKNIGLEIPEIVQECRTNLTMDQKKRDFQFSLQICFDKAYNDLTKNITSIPEQFQFKSDSWRKLYYITLVHVILPWVLYLFVAILIYGSRSCIFFPLTTFLKKFWNECKLAYYINEPFKTNKQQETQKPNPSTTCFNKLWHHLKLVFCTNNEEKGSNIKNIKDKIEEINNKETITFIVEVTSEASFQFFIQILLDFPKLLNQIIEASNSQKSLFDNINLRTISILFSFTSMARSYFKIRNLSKKNALSGKCALIVFLLTTSETILRVLSFGLFLYLYNDNLGSEPNNLRPELALALYYGHVLVMVVFNILFNKSWPCLSVDYCFGLLFNSLSNMYSYNHFDYKLLLRKTTPQNKINSTDTSQNENVRHQTSFLRQVLFYTVFILENAALNIFAAVFFYKNSPNETNVEFVDMTDGFGGKLSFTRYHLHCSFAIIWGLQLICFILRGVYYSMHPSSVSLLDLKSKNQVFFLGTSYEISWRKFVSSCKWLGYIRLTKKIQDKIGQVSDVENQNQANLNDDTKSSQAVIDTASQLQLPLLEREILKFDFNKAYDNVVFREVSTNEHYRKDNPYKIFNYPGKSYVEITFCVNKEDFNRVKSLELQLNHCGTSARGEVDIFLNNNILLEKHLAPKYDFGQESFELCAAADKMSANMEGENKGKEDTNDSKNSMNEGANTIKIVLRRQSPGGYWLSDAAIIVRKTIDEDEDSPINILTFPPQVETNRYTSDVSFESDSDSSENDTDSSNSSNMQRYIEQASECAQS